MKRILTYLWLSASALTASAQSISDGAWTIDFDASQKTLSIANNGAQVLSGVYAEAQCATAAEADLRTLRSTDATAVRQSTQSVSDCFGNGNEYTYTYTFDNGMKMLQTLTFYDGVPYLVARLTLTTADGQQVRSNQLVPIASATTSTLMPNDSKNRMLFVPWDNDGYSKYESKYLSSDMYSYAVTAVFNATSRFGLIAGAVDHDTWKSAIHVSAADNYKIKQMQLISGYTSSCTRDTIQSGAATAPHGTVVGDTVRSSRFVMGCFDDWRQGMETFGQACAAVAPRREWAGGTPYGWSSWGVMQTKVSYQGVIDVADFIRDNLVTHGFHDQQGRVVLSLDAWWNDNLTDTQLKQFVEYCKANNMIPGLYYGPFCLFADINNTVPGTSGKYKFSDIALKQDGKYKVVDGAYCLDPTHKGTKLYILNDITKYKNLGIEYLKCDFMSNGAIEADSWYDSSCHTGIQAYNKGMAYLIKQTGDDIYIDLSISPTFPYQYAHGRRISCDAWASISDTKYVMANASYGWWLNQVYFANDPDHLVLKSLYGNGAESLGVNRARLTSGAITGAYLCGDNFSDNVDAGFPEKSRERALELLTNDDVNEIARTCGSFRPVEGDNASGQGAEELFSYDNGTYVYVAGINYATLLPTQGTLQFDRIGIDPDNVQEIKELWTDRTIDFADGSFSYTVPASDARIYRITKKNGASGITSTQASPTDIRISVAEGRVQAECTTSRIAAISIYNMSGTAVATARPNTFAATISTDNVGRGVYIVKVSTADGTSRTIKANR